MKPQSNIFENTWLDLEKHVEYLFNTQIRGNSSNRSQASFFHKETSR